MERALLGKMAFVGFIPLELGTHDQSRFRCMVSRRWLSASLVS